jgi:hypothetical protein
VTVRLLLLAAMLPLAGLAQLELTLYDATANTETPIGSSLSVGPATVCGPFTSPEIRLRNIGQDPINVTTLGPLNGVIALNQYPLPPFPVPGQSLQAFYISFTPTALGTFNATLTVTGTDAVTQTVYNLNVALTGTSIAAPTLTDSSGNSYCPGGATIYVGKSQVGTPFVPPTTLTLANPTQSAVTATVAEVTPTPGGTDFGPTSPVTVAAGATQTLQLTFTPSVPNTEYGTLTLNGLVYNLAGDGYAAPPPPPPPAPQPTLQLSANANLSDNQAQVSIPLSAAAASVDTGTLKLAFQPSGNLPDDPNIIFIANSTRTVSVQVNPGDTAVQFQAGDGTFQTGTTAGTITFTLDLTVSGVTASASTTIVPAHVALDLSTAVPATDSIILSLAGFDNTHAASMLAFTFYDTTGKAIAPGLIQSDVATAFASYYKTNPDAGGVFNLQATFPVTGDITQVASVDVQFTNPQGVTDTGRLPVQ